MSKTIALWLVASAAYLSHQGSLAWHACDASGSSLCPDGNTCCPTTIGAGDGSLFTCVSGHNASAGACCDDVAAGSTGCGAGFVCASDDLGGRVCRRADPDNAELPERVPRYRLCALEKEALQRIHGFPVVGDDQPMLAYLSTMGAIDNPEEEILNRHIHVETLVVMIHGSGRNADDYLCATHAATPDPEKTLVVAPWFIAPEDGPVNITGSAVPPLVWAEDGPIWHTWRYGADAVNAPVSAYEAIDALVGFAVENVVRFPRLRRVVVAGHSAGGQFTQRWAVLSNSMAFESTHRVHLRVVVANPKSFCYLDDRRYMDDGVLRTPTDDELGNCTTYNEWEWGLGEGDFLPTPYKDRAIEAAGGTDAIVIRYEARDIVYLAGALDVLLNGDCQAQLQGPYRRKRSEHFFAFLKDFYGRQVHHRLVVAGVHHDHALMFQSPEGEAALFGSTAEAYNLLPYEI